AKRGNLGLTAPGRRWGVQWIRLRNSDAAETRGNMAAGPDRAEHAASFCRKRWSRQKYVVLCAAAKAISGQQHETESAGLDAGGWVHTADCVRKSGGAVTGADFAANA